MLGLKNREIVDAAQCDMCQPRTVVRIGISSNSGQLEQVKLSARQRYFCESNGVAVRYRGSSKRIRFWDASFSSVLGFSFLQEGAHALLLVRSGEAVCP